MGPLNTEVLEELWAALQSGHGGASLKKDTHTSGSIQACPRSLFSLAVLLPHPVGFEITF